MRTYTVEGLILKRSNLGEADRLITLFTKNHGKVTALARGVRKLNSKRGGALELFNLVRASVVKGRGGLDTLAEVQLIGSFPAWRKHLGRVAVAYQLIEVVDKLTPDRQPYPRVFEILSGALSQISRLGADWPAKIKDSKLKILVELGYWPEDKEFVADIDKFIETLTARPLHSPKLLARLSS